jgi:CRP-like cAMP-binding protein
VLFSHDTKANALGRCPFFAGLSRSELLELAKATEDMEVEEGKTLTREGASGSEFFVIIDGEVSVTKDGQEIRRLAPGDFFGEIALIQHGRRTATVVTTAPTTLAVMSPPSFDAMRREMPRVAERIDAAIRERLPR